MCRFPLCRSSNPGVAKHLDEKTKEKVENIVKFQTIVPGVKGHKFEAHGYDITILIDVCKAILDADDNGDLSPARKKIAKQARSGSGWKRME